MEAVSSYRIHIITGRFQDAPAEQQDFIHTLFSEDAPCKYELYFHWYNLIHELGHAIMMFNAPARPHPAEEELLVNQFAAAYWQHYGEPKKLQVLQSMIDETIQKFHTPAAHDESYLAYAKRVWGSDEFYTFETYGWFQFSCVIDALSRPLTLQQSLNQMCAAPVSPQPTETLSYTLQDASPSQIITDAIKHLKAWGVLLPDEIDVLFCSDVNCHMCQAEPLSDNE